MTNLSDIIASSNVLTTDNTKTVTNKSIDASQLTGTYPALNGSNITNLTSGNLTGALPAIDGSNLTGISAGLDSAAVSAIIVADVDNPFVDALNVDADTLDGINSLSFLRSDTFDNVFGTLEFQDNVQLRFGGSADTIIEHDTAGADGTRFYANSSNGGMRFQDGSTTCFDVADTVANTTTFFQNVDFSSATVTGLSTGGSGSGISGGVFLEYEKTVDSDYTIDSDGNGRGIFVLSAADDSDGLTIATGATVTVNSGSSWVLTGGDKNMGLDAMVATSNQTERTMRTGTIKPTLDDTYDLGDSAVGYRNIYANAINPQGGNLGIGTSSVDRLLHIEDSNGIAYSSSDFDQTYNLMKIENTNTSTNVATGIQFLVGSNGSTAISATRTGNGEASLCFGTRGGGTRAERMRIDHTGGLRVGTTSNIFNAAANEKASIKNAATGNALTLQSTDVTGGFPILYLYSTDTTATQNAVVFQRTGGGVGTITTTASSTAYNTSSDHRLKENVADMTGAITRVQALAPKRFNFIVDSDTTVDGFLAHEVQTVVPEAVTGTHNEVDSDGNAVMQGIDQSKLVPLLTGALQEAITKIEALEARVTALENA